MAGLGYGGRVRVLGCAGVRWAGVRWAEVRVGWSKMGWGLVFSGPSFSLRSEIGIWYSRKEDVTDIVVVERLL